MLYPLSYGRVFYLLSPFEERSLRSGLKGAAPVIQA
jgi:hypothetical protein